MAGSTVKTSYVPGEVRASVVAALLAVRRSQALPTWRVRATAADLGVSMRPVWRRLEVAESEDGSVVSPVRASWSSRMILSSWLITAATCPALRVAPLAEGRPTPSVSAFRAAFARVLPPGRRAGCVSGERADATSTRPCLVRRGDIATTVGRPTTPSWLSSSCDGCVSTARQARGRPSPSLKRSATVQLGWATPSPAA